MSDDQSEAEMSASRVSDGPEQFLYAVARLVLGDQDSRAEMEKEPEVHRWLFHREGTRVDVRLIRTDDDRAPDSAATLVWSGQHTIVALARSAVRAFDRIDHELGEEVYESRWGRSFPRTELEALRTLMRRHLKAASAPDITK
ncbi:hypothetical protein ACWC3X_18725 [Streptomyces populi]